MQHYVVRPFGSAMQRRFMLLLVACFGLCGAAIAMPEDAVCVPCHKEMAASVAAVQAAQFGCAKCHAAADSSVVPHTNLGFFKGGKVPKVSKSCLVCHDKPEYTQLKHDGMGAACTGCHNSHAPKHGQVVAEATAVCFTCHERKDFEAKHVHDPVAQGTCTDCHAVHATKHPYLLAEPLVKVCMECHSKVKRRPHATIDISGKGHPIGGEKPGLMNPARPDEPFYCGSCHHPHMTALPRLMRYDTKSPLGFCQECHKK
jgi:predicted CXXCH cytochrome family protein